MQLGGFATIPYTGTAPALGLSALAADGSGGVKALESGNKYWVVASDETAKTVTILL